MTATLHALGCGSTAGAYYTDDPNREARPRTRDNYYTREGNGTWWSSGSKCGCRFFTEAENAETTVFRIQLDADLEHFGDTADREDVADSGHDQAA